MSHDHSAHSTQKDIKIAFFLNLGFTVLEVAGGLLTNSVAILADALHDLGDSLSLALSWRLETFAEKAEDDKYSYGYRRFSMLGGLINAIILMIGSFFVISESIIRLKQPQMPLAQGMFLFALAGMALNGYAAFRTGRSKNMNSRIISWHLMEDVLGWAAILIVSVLLLFFDIPILDPLVSILITVYILINVVKNFKRIVSLFLQAVPDEMDLRRIEHEIKELNMVENVHHLHAWSLDGEKHVLTMHVDLCEGVHDDEIRKIKEDIRNLAEAHGFIHTTVEIEKSGDDCSMGLEKINRTV